MNAIDTVTMIVPIFVAATCAALSMADHWLAKTKLGQRAH